MNRKTEHRLYARIGKLVGSAGFSLRRPIFIVGTGRCGSSLLVRLLNSHPDLIGFPGEANEIWHPATYPFSAARIEVPPLVEDPALFTQQSLAHYPPGHDTNIRNVFTGHAFLRGVWKNRKQFFTKSAMISFLLPKIAQIFPDARFLHLYRYGPAVVESFLKKEWGKYSNYFESEDHYRKNCARYWNRCILEIEARKKELGDRYFEIGYEKLCGEPEKSLQSLSNFLEVDPTRFGFDLTTIQSQNHKSRRAPGEKEAFRILMKEGLQLLDYET